MRAANDAAARRVLLQASELQGRGEFDAAVMLLEAVEVQGLSRETSEHVFGRWSAACSLLGQTGGLELLRYSPSQGLGIIVHRDPGVPYGRVVFSSLGMGPSYLEGRVVSAVDREGGAFVARARKFRTAEFLPELSAAWNASSYVVSQRADCACAPLGSQNVLARLVAGCEDHLPRGKHSISREYQSQAKEAVSFDICSVRR